MSQYYLNLARGVPHPSNLAHHPRLPHRNKQQKPRSQKRMEQREALERSTLERERERESRTSKFNPPPPFYIHRSVLLRRSAAPSGTTQRAAPARKPPFTYFTPKLPKLHPPPTAHRRSPLFLRPTTRRLQKLAAARQAATAGPVLLHQALHPPPRNWHGATAPAADPVLRRTVPSSSSSARPGIDSPTGNRGSPDSKKGFCCGQPTSVGREQ